MSRRTVLTVAGAAAGIGVAGDWRLAQAANLYASTAAATRAPLDLSALRPARMAELVRLCPNPCAARPSKSF